MPRGPSPRICTPRTVPPEPGGATLIDGTGRTVYPGLIDGLTTLGLTGIGSVAGSVAVPVARANGITAALAAPTGGLVSGQSALIRMSGSTPDALTVKTPVGMHVVYPTGRPPFDIARMFEEPELKTFEERQKDKKKNVEKDLRRLANLLEEARAYGEALRAGRAKPDRSSRWRPPRGASGRSSSGPTPRTRSGARWRSACRSPWRPATRGSTRSSRTGAESVRRTVTPAPS
jgi:hypothetical protein